ncbi:hypothetical protein GCM10010172_60260 [Paractinoplanes ferrugineus]|uniref:Uncharacterized protein n=1 Tax=Paractinoplanes ferrugineus TaxID=113564 RepID=A0A919JCB4_9ACTN|nr:hypothetical protein Afe05nite_85440 [Actinoplanes ferrugineus]
MGDADRVEWDTDGYAEDLFVAVDDVRGGETAAHQGLDDDISKYEANAGIEPAITEPPVEPAKPRRTRKPRA